MDVKDVKDVALKQSHATNNELFEWKTRYQYIPKFKNKVVFQNGLRSKYDSLYVRLVAFVVLHLQISI